MAEVTLSGVSKRFGDVLAVDTLDLEIRDGVLTVLAGPCGSGKSTVLRMIAGLEEATDGTIEIDGREVDARSPEGGDIVMACLGDGLLDGALDEPSGGEGRRAPRGRASARQPSLVLVDEPPAGLDPGLRARLLAALTRFQEERGATVVYATADPGEAMAVGEWLGVLDAGRLQQVGTPRELYGRPVDLFVARFFGTPPMNLLPAELTGGGTRLAGDGFALPVPALCREAVSAGEGPFLVGVRPEHLSPWPEPARGETVPFLLRVESVEPSEPRYRDSLTHRGSWGAAPARRATEAYPEVCRGERSAAGADEAAPACDRISATELSGCGALVHGRVGRNRLVARVALPFAARPGTVVTLCVRVGSIHLFDAQTGLRLQ